MHTEQQGAKPMPGPGRIGKAHDNELLPALAFDLHPVAMAPGDIGSFTSFRDQALHLSTTGFVEDAAQLCGTHRTSIHESTFSLWNRAHERGQLRLDPIRKAGGRPYRRREDLPRLSIVPDPIPSPCRHRRHRLGRLGKISLALIVSKTHGRLLYFPPRVESSLRESNPLPTP